MFTLRSRKRLPLLLSFLTILLFFSPESHAASIWNSSDTPANPAVTDGVPIEVGTKFQTDVNGYVTALRFYKGAANTGTHIGHLWTRTGTLLASATFTSETASGWQEVQLSSPVAIQAGTTYVVSYHSSSGYFAMTESYFTVGIQNPPLRALATGVDGGNGVYKEGASGFPTQTWNGNNYWADVVFNSSTGDTIAPTVTSFSVPTAANSITVPITSFTASDNVGVTGYLISESSATPSPNASGWSATPQTSYTFATAGSKTLYAWAKDASDNVSAGSSAAVTITLSSLWNNSTVPTRPAVTDGSPIEVGVKFQADVAGHITGLRFYKGSANTGTHVGHLWSRTGTLLATATFTGETASGWQQLQFSTPVAIQAGTTYVASYHSSSGYFALDESYFTTDLYNPPLRAPATGVDGGNGVYKYGASGFPTETWSGNNYWVDVVFSQNDTGDTAPPTITSFTMPTTATSLTVPVVQFTANDNVGVTGYLLTESSAAPSPTISGWAATAPTAYTFATAGSKTLYAWAKDAANNVSTSLNAGVTITLTDSTAPTVTSFSVPATAPSLTVPITGFTATDNVGVTGYIVTESSTAPLSNATGWTTTPPTAYTFAASGSKTLYAWAKDAAGNVSISMSASVTVGDQQLYSIWNSGTVPTQAAVSDGTPIEVGVKFQADVSGSITALRFYKGTANTGTHVGHLWSSTGTLLATATFTGETASGWQQVQLSTPVTIQAGSTYVASYHSSSGYFAMNEGFFTADVYNPPLRALATGVDGGNGVYKVGASGFPTETWNGNNYWVDVVFSPNDSIDVLPPAVTSFTVPDTANSLNVPITSFTATDNVGVTGYLITESPSKPLPSAIGWTATVPSSYTFATAGSKTLYAWAKDAGGNVSNSMSASVTINTGQFYSIWNSGTTPSQPAVSDGVPIELGVKFRSDAAGFITALRFYKGSANTGTHVGHLWNRTGTLLATATFTGETASGWQQVQLSNPVAIQAGTTYVASYHSSSGYFAMNEGFFTADVYNPPLRALATGVDGGNGVYKTGASGFPTETWNGNNYWVDVVFSPSGTGDTIAPTMTSFSMPSTATSLTVPITSFTATDNVGVSGYLLTESSVKPSPDTGGWTATAPTAFTFATTGSKTLYAWAKDAAGNVSNSMSASVTIGGIDQFFSIWNSGTIPSQPAVSDGSPIEVGVKFQADVAGSITGLRFYKGSANTGTHVGHLWSRTGTLLATATFTGETASGWQEVQLSTPVAIQAGTTYVASYHSSTGYFAVDQGYFTTDDYTPPLRALASGADGGNGVYKAGASGFPTESWNANNYWVDVVFNPEATTDPVPPNITSFTIPTTTSSLVVPITAFTASDNVGVTGYLVNQSSAMPSPTASGWSATAPTAYAFTTEGSKTLYAWAKDAAGNVSPGASDSVTITLTDPTPPTVTSFSVPASSTSLTVSITAFTATDNLGVTGYLVNESSTVPTPIAAGWSATAQTSYTFASAGSKTLYAWAKDAAGRVSAARSASVNVNPPDNNPPTVTSFTVPDAATTLTVPIISFTATDDVGVTGYLITESPATPSATAAGWSATAQTFYTFTSAGSKTLYAWAKDAADRVSTSRSASVNITLPGTPPVVSTVLPPGNALSVSTGTVLNAVFNEAMTASTINATTFQLRDSANSLVAATVTYDSSTNTATLTPTSLLSVATSYTAVIKGGTSGVKSVVGIPLAADHTWTFNSSASTPFDNGPGGPILVITSAANPFSRYLAEILGAEGLNAYAVRDISLVTASLLAQYEVAILGNMAITVAQADMLGDWVVAGGNLIAMRPDKDLAGLLGLADTATTLAEGYLQVNTSSGPGSGIVGQTIQYHGTADRYNLAGASTLATLYSDATTPTANPAVTLRSVGSNGGQAAAFTFDLARSVVYTRQGNPNWVDQDRDGQPPTRANDLFYGAAAGDPKPDWVDLAKVTIPQADEQQRLLANMIIRMNADKKPLPRFWYFPHQYEAVVIMTGDDHDGMYGNYGTEGRFAYETTISDAGCSVADWECIRSSSYLITKYPTGIITDAEAVAFNSAGFEIGAHINTNCAAFTDDMLAGFFREQTKELQTLFPSLPPPVSHRQHCIAWSGYTILPEEEEKYGFRLDTNYYYWPAAWAATPGFFTGSGMPMRFTNTNGNLIDVYQAVTQLTDESGQAYPYTLDTLLDRAIGPEKYYGAFTTNIHTDYVTSNDYTAIISSAQSRGVPLISAKQMLIWLDGRNGSKFSDLTWSGNVFGFKITQAQGATGLQAMVPVPTGLGITGFTRNGSSVNYQLKTIKGVQYAFFSALTGTYSVTMAANP